MGFRHDLPNCCYSFVNPEMYKILCLYILKREMLYAGYPCSLICRVGRGVGISGFPSRVGKTGSSPQKLDVPYCRTVFAWLRLGRWGWSWAGLDE